MRNLLYFSVFLTGIFVLIPMFSQTTFAQCIVTGTTPSGGQVVNCAGTDPDGITTTNMGDDITVEPGADISRGGSQAAIETLDGDDKVQINGGTITETGPNGDGVGLGGGNNVLHMKAGTVIGAESGIQFGVGSATVTIDNGEVRGMTEEGLKIGGGNGEIHIKNGTFIGQVEGIQCFPNTTCKLTIDKAQIRGITQEGIQLGNGNNEAYIKGGVILGSDAAFQTGIGNDIIMITGGFFKQDDNDEPTLRFQDGNDLISISNATIDGSMTNKGAIWAGRDDDIVRLGTGAEVLGKIWGNNGVLQQEGFDTLVFEMRVPEDEIDALCAEIESLDPADDSIIINRLFYEWMDFDVIECELQPIVPNPIPTLSEWGLIAMAGILGIVGLLASRRRKVAA